jgi:hypothetical protein
MAPRPLISAAPLRLFDKYPLPHFAGARAPFLVAHCSSQLRFLFFLGLLQGSLELLLRIALGFRIWLLFQFLLGLLLRSLTGILIWSFAAACRGLFATTALPVLERALLFLAIGSYLLLPGVLLRFRVKILLASLGFEGALVSLCSRAFP